MNTKRGWVNNSGTLKIYSNLDEICNVVNKMLEALSIDKPISFDIRLCLEEAIINAIKHGNKNNKKLPVIISYDISDNKFTVSVEDKGKGFNHRKIPNPTKKRNLLKIKGRGIYLIKYMMDDISFNKEGNKITMTKYLKKPACRQAGGKYANKQK